MSINYWRYVGYLGDGASRYQCLSCYEKWDSGTTPGWFDQGAYRPCWKFCPYCGTEWSGMWTTEYSPHHEHHKQFGRRRQIIEAALDARQGRPEPPYWLVVERAEQVDQDKPLQWAPVYKMSGFHPSSQKMLKLAREDAKMRAADAAYYSVLDFDPFGWKKKKFFARVVVVRDFKKQYPHQTACEI